MHEEKIINELIEIAYKSIQRTKGAEYAPNVHEIQLCINQYVANKLSQKLEEPKQQTQTAEKRNCLRELKTKTLKTTKHEKTKITIGLRFNYGCIFYYRKLPFILWRLEM